MYKPYSKSTSYSAESEDVSVVGDFPHQLSIIAIHFPGCSMLFKDIPIGSMYGIFTYICHKFKPNVGKYSSPMEHLGLNVIFRFERSHEIQTVQKL